MVRREQKFRIPSRRSGVIYFLVLVVLSCLACHKELDQLKLEDWNPILAVPLVQTTFTVHDILASADTSEHSFEITEAGVLALRYTTEAFTFGLDSVLVVEDQQFSHAEVLDAAEAAIIEAAGGLTFPVTHQFNIDVGTSDLRLDEVLLSSGTLVLDVAFNTQEFFAANLSIPAMLDVNGAPFQTVFSGAEGDVFQVLDLSGYRMFPEHPTSSENSMEFLLQVTFENNPDYTSQPGDGVSVDVALSGLGIQHILGDFGNLSMDFTADSILLDVFNEAIDVDYFRLAEATIDLNITNGFGMPVALDLSEVFSEDLETGDQTNLALLEPVVLQGQTFMESPPEHTTYSVTQDNSNVLDFLAPAPQIVHFVAAATANPDGPPQPPNVNFITADSRMDVGVDVLLPLRGFVQNLQLTDTVEADFGTHEFDNIESLELRLETTNGFPLSGDIQIGFLDSAKGSLGSLFPTPMSVIGPANVDAFGHVNAPTQEVTFATLEQEDFQSMSEVRYLVVQSTLNTANAQDQQVVAFEEHAAFTVRIGAKIFGHIALE